MKIANGNYQLGWLQALVVSQILILGACGGGGGGGGGGPIISADTTPPAIALNGDNPMSVARGEVFTDPGATAIDDTDISVLVVHSGSVNTSIAGEYEITYTATDSAGNVSSVTRIVAVLRTVAVTAQATTSGETIRRILGAGSEIFNYMSSASISTSNDSGFLVLAVNDSDVLEYIGLAGSDQDSLDLGAKSTAQALLVLFPLIAPVYDQSPADIVAIFSQNPEVLALEDAIAATPYWSQMTDATVLQSYADAVVSVLTDIGPPTPLAQTNNSNRVPVTPYDDDLTKSGVTLTVMGEFGGIVGDPHVILSLENDYSRWVRVLAKNDDRVVQNYDLPPKSSSVGEDNKYNIGDISGNGLVISAIGPGIGMAFDELGGYTPDYLLASVYTFVTEVASPTIGVITGASKCIDIFLDPRRIGGLLQSNFLTSEIVEMITAGAYGEAGLQVTLLGLEAINDAQISCLQSAVAKKIAIYLVPVLGEIQLLMQVAELSARLAPFGYAWISSLKVETWTIENNVNMEFYMEGIGFVSANIALQGSLNYTTTEGIGDEWRASYAGDCPTLNENPTCEGYTFDSDGPYTVSFRLSCIDPGNGTTIPCDRAIFTPDVQNSQNAQVHSANDTGEVVFSHDYNEAKEFKGAVEVVDLYGAVKRHQFSLQIKKAEPQVVLKLDGSELPSAVTLRELTNTEPIELICCDANSESVTKTVELHNRGLKAGTITTATTIGSAGFSMTEASSLTIDPLSSVTFSVTYTPLDNSDISSPGTFLFQGDLGGIFLGNTLGNTNIEYYDYESIRINVTGIPENTAPVAVIEVISPSSFSGSGSYDQIVSYEWTAEQWVFRPPRYYDLTTFDYSGETIEHAFDFPGDYPVTLRVTDDNGLTDTATVQIHVDNTLPNIQTGSECIGNNGYAYIHFRVLDDSYSGSLYLSWDTGSYSKGWWSEYQYDGWYTAVRTGETSTEVTLRAEDVNGGVSETVVTVEGCEPGVNYGGGTYPWPWP